MRLFAQLSLLALAMGANAGKQSIPPRNRTLSVSNDLSMSAFGASPLVPKDILARQTSCRTDEQECGINGCCPSDGECCGLSHCCEAGNFCLNKGLGLCCEETKEACGSSDCYSPDQGDTCCDDGGLSGHCVQGESCCGIGCCPEGYHCEDDECVEGAAALLQSLGSFSLVVFMGAWVVWSEVV